MKSISALLQQRNLYQRLGYTRPVSRLSPPFTRRTPRQAGFGLERQFTQGHQPDHCTYLHSFGAHQLVTINANQYNPAWTRAA